MWARPEATLRRWPRPWAEQFQPPCVFWGTFPPEKKPRKLPTSWPVLGVDAQWALARTKSVHSPMPSALPFRPTTDLRLTETGITLKPRHTWPELLWRREVLALRDEPPRGYPTPQWLRLRMRRLQATATGTTPTGSQTVRPRWGLI